MSTDLQVVDVTMIILTKKGARTLSISNTISKPWTCEVGKVKANKQIVYLLRLIPFYSSSHSTQIHTESCSEHWETPRVHLACQRVVWIQKIAWVAESQLKSARPHNFFDFADSFPRCMYVGVFDEHSITLVHFASNTGGRVGAAHDHHFFFGFFLRPFFFSRFRCFVRIFECDPTFLSGRVVSHHQPSPTQLAKWRKTKKKTRSFCVGTSVGSDRKPGFRDRQAKPTQKKARGSNFFFVLGQPKANQTAAHFEMFSSPTFQKKQGTRIQFALQVDSPLAFLLHFPLPQRQIKKMLCFKCVSGKTETRKLQTSKASYLSSAQVTAHVMAHSMGTSMECLSGRLSARPSALHNCTRTLDQVTEACGHECRKKTQKSHQQNLFVILFLFFAKPTTHTKQKTNIRGIWWQLAPPQVAIFDDGKLPPIFDLWNFLVALRMCRVFGVVCRKARKNVECIESDISSQTSTNLHEKFVNFDSKWEVTRHTLSSISKKMESVQNDRNSLSQKYTWKLNRGGKSTPYSLDHVHTRTHERIHSQPCPFCFSQPKQSTRGYSLLHFQCQTPLKKRFAFIFVCAFLPKTPSSCEGCGYVFSRLFVDAASLFWQKQKQNRGWTQTWALVTWLRIFPESIPGAALAPHCGKSAILRARCTGFSPARRTRRQRTRQSSPQSYSSRTSRRSGCLGMAAQCAHSEGSVLDSLLDCDSGWLSGFSSELSLDSLSGLRSETESVAE